MSQQKNASPTHTATPTASTDDGLRRRLAVMDHRPHPTLKGEIQRADVRGAVISTPPSLDVAPQTTQTVDPVVLHVPEVIVAPEPSSRELEAPRLKHIGRPRGRKSNPSRAARRVALRLVSDPVYQEKLRERLRDGTAPAHMEAVLWAYAYGKPVAKHEVSTEASLIVSVQRPW